MTEEMLQKGGGLLHFLTTLAKVRRSHASKPWREVLPQ